jgi:hypothetical protein
MYKTELFYQIKNILHLMDNRLKLQTTKTKFQTNLQISILKLIGIFYCELDIIWYL